MDDLPLTANASELLAILQTLVADGPIAWDSEYGGSCFFCGESAGWNYQKQAYDCAHDVDCLWIRVVKVLAEINKV